MININDKNTYEIIDEWLNELRTSKNKQKKEKLKALIVTNMLPIIKRIAHTIARRSYDPIDDMVQAGSIGLLKAIESYSHNINDNFKIYAGYLIIGEMKHYLRDKLSTIRVPGHVQELMYRINTFSASLTVEELNDLTNDEVADALHVSSKAINTVRQIERRGTTISLDDVFSASSDSLNYEEMLSAEDYIEYSEINDCKIILKEIIEKLPDDFKEFIELYYSKDMNQREIAEFKGLSVMQVHRKMRNIFNVMHEMITNNKDVVNFNDVIEA